METWLDHIVQQIESIGPTLDKDSIARLTNAVESIQPDEVATGSNPPIWESDPENKEFYETAQRILTAGVPVCQIYVSKMMNPTKGYHKDRRQVKLLKQWAQKKGLQSRRGKAGIVDQDFYFQTEMPVSNVERVEDALNRLNPNVDEFDIYDISEMTRPELPALREYRLSPSSVGKNLSKHFKYRVARVSTGHYRRTLVPLAQ